MADPCVNAVSYQYVTVLLLILNQVVKGASSCEHSADAEEMSDAYQTQPDDQRQLLQQKGRELKDIEVVRTEVVFQCVLICCDAMRHNVKLALVNQIAVPYELFRMEASDE